jgi:tetratricopeptide (TPR) repeat protein
MDCGSAGMDCIQRGWRAPIPRTRLACECSPTYSGAACETEADACASAPCQFGHTCHSYALPDLREVCLRQTTPRSCTAIAYPTRHRRPSSPRLNIEDPADPATQLLRDRLLCSAEHRCGRCEGHCSSDADCQSGLKCFLRKGSSVPRLDLNIGTLSRGYQSFRLEWHLQSTNYLQSVPGCVAEYPSAPYGRVVQPANINVCYRPSRHAYHCSKPRPPPGTRPAYAQHTVEPQTPGRLQLVMNSAHAGDEILLDRGTHVNHCRNARSVTCALRHVVEIHKDITIGKYDGRVVLDGENMRRVIGIFDGDVVLEGLDIIRGSVVGQGGGIYVQSQGVVSISNCNIYSNTAQGTMGGLGGGVALLGGRRVSFTTCTIHNNLAQQGSSTGSAQAQEHWRVRLGGGIFGGGMLSSASFTDCDIYANEVGAGAGTNGCGGGASFAAGVAVSFQSCQIHDNIANMYIVPQHTLHPSWTVDQGGLGAGIHTRDDDGGSLGRPGEPTIQLLNCRVEANTNANWTLLPGLHPVASLVLASHYSSRRTPSNVQVEAGNVCTFNSRMTDVIGNVSICRIGNTSCGSGQYKAGNSCRACQAGRYQLASSHNDVSCIACAAGRYHSSTAGVRCYSCATGKYNAQRGSQSRSSCILCNAGKYNPNVASASPSACINCSAGTYSLSPGGAATCTDCPSGNTSPIGSTSTSACHPPCCTDVCTPVGTTLNFGCDGMGVGCNGCNLTLCTQACGGSCAYAPSTGGADRWGGLTYTGCTAAASMVQESEGHTEPEPMPEPEIESMTCDTSGIQSRGTKNVWRLVNSQDCPSLLPRGSSCSMTCTHNYSVSGDGILNCSDDILELESCNAPCWQIIGSDQPSGACPFCCGGSAASCCEWESECECGGVCLCSSLHSASSHLMLALVLTIFLPIIIMLSWIKPLDMSAAEMDEHNAQTNIGRANNCTIDTACGVAELLAHSGAIGDSVTLLRTLVRVLRGRWQWKIRHRRADVSELRQLQTIESQLAAAASIARLHAQQALDEGRTLMREFDFEQACALFEQGLQCQAPEPSLNEALTADLRDAKAQQLIVAAAENKAAEARCLATAGLHERAMQVYEAALTEIKFDCDVRVKLRKGLAESVDEHRKQSAVLEAAAEAKRLIDDGEFERAARIQHSGLPGCGRELLCAPFKAGIGHQAQSQLLCVLDEAEAKVAANIKVQQALDEGRTLMREFDFEQACALFEQGLQCQAPEPSLNEALTAGLRDAKAQQLIVAAAENKAAEARCLATAGLHERAMQVYEAALTEIKFDCDVRAKLRKGLAESVDEHRKQSAVLEAAAEAKRLIDDGHLAIAAAFVQTVIANDMTFIRAAVAAFDGEGVDVDALTETESEEDSTESESEQASNLANAVPSSPTSQIELITTSSSQLRQQKLFQIVHLAEKTCRVGAAPPPPLLKPILSELLDFIHAIQLSTTYDTRLAKAATASTDAKDACQHLLNTGKHEAGVSALRKALLLDVRSENIYKELEDNLFETLVSMNTGTVGSRKEALQYKLSGLDPDTEQYAEVARAVAQLADQEEVGAVKTSAITDSNELNEFQQLQATEQDRHFENLTVGVSAAWLNELCSASSCKRIQDFGASILESNLELEAPCEDGHRIARIVLSHESFSRKFHGAKFTVAAHASGWREIIDSYLLTAQALWDMLAYETHGLDGSYMQKKFITNPRDSGIGLVNISVCVSSEIQYVRMNESVQNYIQKEKLNEQGVFLWIDALSVDLSSLGHSTNLEAPAAQAELCLVVLEPWYSPGPLNNSYCLEQLQASLDVDSEIAIVMSNAGQIDFHMALVTEGIEYVHKQLSTVAAAGVTPQLIHMLGEKLRDSLWSLTVSCDVQGIVWVDDSDMPINSSTDTGQPGIARVTKDNGDEVVVALENKSSQLSNIAKQDLRHANPPSQNLADDLTHLDFMSDLSLLNTLRHRYCGGNVHHGGDHSSSYCTFIGNILIYVNPYAPILQLDSGISKCVWTNDFHLQDYLAHKFKARQNTSLRPHAYTIADLTLAKLLQTRTDQAIYVAGESGAGKTEACKLVMEYLLAAVESAPAISGSLTLAQVLSQSDFVMEAFGNAMTINNPNSSRFVKYLKLVVSHTGQLVGATVNASLLEKTRVCRRSNVTGKNFHIFEYLGDPRSKPSSREMRDITTWLADIGFADNHVNGICNIVRAVALLEELELNQRGQFTSSSDVKILCKCLGVKSEDFEKELCLATTNMHDDSSKSSNALYVKVLQRSIMQMSADLNSRPTIRYNVEACTLPVGTIVRVFKRTTLPKCGTVRIKVRSHKGSLARSGWVTERSTEGALLMLPCDSPDEESATALTTPQAQEQAQSIRSALAKDLYDALFDAVLQQFNARIGQDSRQMGTDKRCSLCNSSFWLAPGVNESCNLCFKCHQEKVRNSRAAHSYSLGFMPNITCSQCHQEKAVTPRRFKNYASAQCGICRLMVCNECSCWALPAVAKPTADRATQLHTNDCVWCFDCLSKTAVCDAPNTNTLGILDIFGCEKFDINELEQLCINFTNERLHNAFLQEVFKNEGQLYEDEGISLEEAGIRFVDNTPTLQMLSGVERKSRKCIFAVLNSADSENRFQTQIQILAQSDDYQNGNRHAGNLVANCSNFTVKHYFGNVSYSFYSGFVKKNKDRAPERFLRWWQSTSKNPMATQLRLVDTLGAIDEDSMVQNILKAPQFRQRCSQILKRWLRLSPGLDRGGLSRLVTVTLQVVIDDHGVSNAHLEIQSGRENNSKSDRSSKNRNQFVFSASGTGANAFDASQRQRDSLQMQLSNLVRAQARWTKCKFGALENLSGLVEARSQMTTADQCYFGTSSLFAAIPAATRPHFIRCINPKRAGVAVAPCMSDRFDVIRVREQLLNNGIVDTVQVRQQGFAYRRDKLAFLESYSLLLPKPLLDAIETGDIDTWTVEEVDAAIITLFDLLDDVSSEEYIVGQTMLFIKSTDTIGILNREMAVNADAGCALEHAVNETEKSDVEYCQDLFVAIFDAIKKQVIPEDIEHARSVLVDKMEAFAERADYDAFEQACVTCARSKTLQLRGRLRGKFALQVATAALTRLGDIRLTKFDSLDLRLTSAATTVDVHTAYWSADSQLRAIWKSFVDSVAHLSVSEMVMNGLDNKAVEVVADQLVTDNDGIACRTLRRLSINSTGRDRLIDGGGESTLYILEVATPAVRTLDLRSHNLSDSDALLLSRWLQRREMRPVTSVAVQPSCMTLAGMQYLSSISNARAKQLRVFGVEYAVRKAMIEEQVNTASDKLQEFARRLAERQSAVIVTMQKARPDFVESPACQQVLEKLIAAAITQMQDSLRRGLSSTDLSHVRNVLQQYLQDRGVACLEWNALDLRRRELENQIALKRLMRFTVDTQGCWIKSVSGKGERLLRNAEDSSICSTTTSAALGQYAQVGPDAALFMHAQSLLQNTWVNRATYTLCNIEHVVQVINTKLSQRFDQYKQQHGGSEFWAFHGCYQQETVVSSLCNNGFLRDYWDHTCIGNKVFGNGCYFPKQACQAHEAPPTNVDILKPGQQVYRRKLLLCKIATGRVYTPTAADSRKLGPGFRVDTAHDSVIASAEQGTGITYDQVVTYDPDSVLPVAIVQYAFRKRRATSTTDNSIQAQYWWVFDKGTHKSGEPTPAKERFQENISSQLEVAFQRGDTVFKFSLGSTAHEIRQLPSACPPVPHSAVPHGCYQINLRTRFVRAVHRQTLSGLPHSASLGMQNGQWTYLDDSGTEQGPFPFRHLQAWFRGGQLTMDRKLRRAGDTGEFVPLRSIPALVSQLQSLQRQQQQATQPIRYGSANLAIVDDASIATHQTALAQTEIRFPRCDGHAQTASPAQGALLHQVNRGAMLSVSPKEWIDPHDGSRWLQTDFAGELLDVTVQAAEESVNANEISPVQSPKSRLLTSVGSKLAMSCATAVDPRAITIQVHRLPQEVYFGMSFSESLEVVAVARAGPADRSGMQLHSVIIGVDGHPVVSRVDLTRALTAIPESQKMVTFSVLPVDRTLNDSNYSDSSDSSDSSTSGDSSQDDTMCDSVALVEIRHEEAKLEARVEADRVAYERAKAAAAHRSEDEDAATLVAATLTQAGNSSEPEPEIDYSTMKAAQILNFDAVKLAATKAPNQMVLYSDDTDLPAVPACVDMLRRASIVNGSCFSPIHFARRCSRLNEIGWPGQLELEPEPEPELILEAQSVDLVHWLAAIKCEDLLAHLAANHGTEQVQDLLDLEPEHVNQLCELLKTTPVKKFRRALENLRSAVVVGEADIEITTAAASQHDQRGLLHRMATAQRCSIDELILLTADELTQLAHCTQGIDCDLLIAEHSQYRIALAEYEKDIVHQQQRQAVHPMPYLSKRDSGRWSVCGMHGMDRTYKWSNEASQLLVALPQHGLQFEFPETLQNSAVATGSSPTQSRKSFDGELFNCPVRAWQQGDFDRSASSRSLDCSRMNGVCHVVSTLTRMCDLRVSMEGFPPQQAVLERIISAVTALVVKSLQQVCASDDLEQVRAFLKQYEPDRAIIPKTWEALDRRRQELENSKVLQQLAGLPGDKLSEISVNSIRQYREAFRQSALQDFAGVGPQIKAMQIAVAAIPEQKQILNQCQCAFVEVATHLCIRLCNSADIMAVSEMTKIFSDAREQLGEAWMLLNHNLQQLTREQNEMLQSVTDSKNFENCTEVNLSAVLQIIEATIFPDSKIAAARTLLDEKSYASLQLPNSAEDHIDICGCPRGTWVFIDDCDFGPRWGIYLQLTKPPSDAEAAPRTEHLIEFRTTVAPSPLYLTQPDASNKLPKSVAVKKLYVGWGLSCQRGLAQQQAQMTDTLIISGLAESLDGAYQQLRVNYDLKRSESSHGEVWVAGQWPAYAKCNGSVSIESIEEHIRKSLILEDSQQHDCSSFYLLSYSRGFWQIHDTNGMDTWQLLRLLNLKRDCRTPPTSRDRHSTRTTASCPGSRENFYRRCQLFLYTTLWLTIYWLMASSAAGWLLAAAGCCWILLWLRQRSHETRGTHVAETWRKWWRGGWQFRWTVWLFTLVVQQRTLTYVDDPDPDIRASSTVQVTVKMAFVGAVLICTIIILGGDRKWWGRHFCNDTVSIGRYHRSISARVLRFCLILTTVFVLLFLVLWWQHSTYWSNEWPWWTAIVWLSILVTVGFCSEVAPSLLTSQQSEEETACTLPPSRDTIAYIRVRNGPITSGQWNTSVAPHIEAGSIQETATLRLALAHKFTQRLALLCSACGLFSAVLSVLPVSWLLRSSATGVWIGCLVSILVVPAWVYWRDYNRSLTTTRHVTVTAQWIPDSERCHKPASSIDMSWDECGEIEQHGDVRIDDGGAVTDLLETSSRVPTLSSRKIQPMAPPANDGKQEGDITWGVAQVRSDYSQPEPELAVEWTSNPVGIGISLTSQFVVDEV